MMKKLLILAMSLILTLMFTACSETAKESSAPEQQASETKSETTQKSKKDTKILVAYFSHAGENYQVGYIEKGNTHIVADMIAEATGADEFEIKTVKPYPKTYKECTDIAKQELADNSRPELDGKVDDMSKYDTIFLGYPIWWSDMPMAVYTFLESYDFKDKTIIPFCTSAGDYMTGKEINIPQIAEGSSIKDGIGIVGKRCQDDPEGVKKDVNEWIKSLGF